jgi:ABC-type branched-subunit amino acid transport system substrate-binding protein
MRVLSRLLLALACTLAPAGAHAQSDVQTIGIADSLSGSGTFYGAPELEGARLAVQDANSVPGAAPVALDVEDDQSSPRLAGQIATKIVTSDDVDVIGPVLTVTATPASPVYAAGGIANILANAHGDALTDNATSFRTIFNNHDQGAALTDYLNYVLKGQDVYVVYRDDAFGRPLAFGIVDEANNLGLVTEEIGFDNDSERADAIKAVVQDPVKPAIILAMLAADAVPIVKALRRAGVTAPILCPDGMAGDNFAKLFAGEPEELAHPGFFTENLYAASPVIFDSANQAQLEFAARFRAFVGHDPAPVTLQGYDTAMLAINAARYAVQAVGASAPLAQRRQAAIAYLTSLEDPGKALPGITGPLWFNDHRGRQGEPVRIGRFDQRLFQSAPLQLVPVAQPDPAQIASGELRHTAGGGDARIQQVVYTGMYLNQVSHLDIAKSSFEADFYLWVRYTPAANIGGQDPVDISFPDIVTGKFDAAHPDDQRTLPDGSVYKLWRVQADFQNDYDLHHYPFDQQRLVVRLFNAKADSSRIVYVLDRLSFPGIGQAPPPAQPAGGPGTAMAAEMPTANSLTLQAAPDAFRDLTQWNPLAVQQVRDDLVTESSLGDPELVGLERQRELSGFELLIDVKRKMLATLSKSLLPLGLMTLIMFASLYFPHGLVKEKVTVAVTGALSGAVLLAALNTQLGTVGYTMAVEYIFYVYFALSLLCIVSVLTAERFRSAGNGKAAVRTELSSRALFAFLAVATGIAVFASQSQ